MVRLNEGEHVRDGEKEQVSVMEIDRVGISETLSVGEAVMERVISLEADMVLEGVWEDVPDKEDEREKDREENVCEIEEVTGRDMERDGDTVSEGLHDMVLDSWSEVDSVGVDEAVESVMVVDIVGGEDIEPVRDAVYDCVDDTEWDAVKDILLERENDFVDVIVVVKDVRE